MMRYYEGSHLWRLGYDFYADIAEKIVSQRKERGLTQEQLAKLSGLESSKLKRYESVSIRMRLSDIEKIAKVLDVQADVLMGAEYCDPDCQNCLYTVCTEKDKAFSLYFKAKSPQEAFLEAYEWSIKAHIRWFESRDRALVRLVGVPVRKSDYAHFRKRTSDEDEICHDSAGKENAPAPAGTGDKRKRN